MRHRLTFGALLLTTVTGAVGCGTTGGYNLPPAERIMEPGPGVGGPGPGVLMSPPSAITSAAYIPEGGTAGGAGCYDAGAGAGGVAMAGMQVPSQPVQLWFGRPESMQLSWDTTGNGDFTGATLLAPARATFQTGGLYRIKLSNIPNRAGLELYPSVEVAPPSYRTAAFLAHSAIPVQFTEEDLDQVSAGNFVTKVIYLPDPEFQELTVPGVRTLVSTRLDPGLDPIEEADRRGAILAIVRLGNKDMEMPGGSSEVTQATYQGAQGPQILPATYGGGMGGIAPANYGAQHPAPVSTPAAMMAARPAAMPAQHVVGGAVAPLAPMPADYSQSMGSYVSEEPVGSGACADGSCASDGAMMDQSLAMGPGGMPPGLMGAPLPQYGLPITGTPIGLPGPPHIPLGAPAGLQSHVMRNWTKMHIPQPTSQVKINVKQRPGLSYPQPASRAWVTEDTIHPQVSYGHHNYGVPASGYQQTGGVGASGVLGQSAFGGGLFGRLFHGASGNVDCQTCPQ